MGVRNYSKLQQVLLAIETESMFMSYLQNTGQIHYIKIANKAFENVAKFRCLGKVLTNQNLINLCLIN
jgi:hypothetical protein